MKICVQTSHDPVEQGYGAPVTKCHLTVATPVVTNTVTTTPTTTSPVVTGQLPFTGAKLDLFLLVGFALLLSGWYLRRHARRSRSNPS